MHPFCHSTAILTRYLRNLWLGELDGQAYDAGRTGAHSHLTRAFDRTSRGTLGQRFLTGLKEAVGKEVRALKRRSGATSIAIFGAAAAVLVAALLLAPACADETGGPQVDKPVPTPEPTATPENLALKMYVQDVQYILDRRAETKAAADQAIENLRDAATSDLMTPHVPTPKLISSMTQEEIEEMLSGRPPALSEQSQQALTDTIARLRSISDAAHGEEADLGGLVVPVEGRRVHELLTGSLSKQSAVWDTLLNHCSQVLNREANWELSQLDDVDRLLLEARVALLEAELQLGDLARGPGIEGEPQAVQDTEPPPGFVVEQRLDVDLDGDGALERVQVSVKEGGTRQAEARLDVFTPAGSGAWLKILEQEHGPIWDCSIGPLAETSLTGDFRKQAVFSLSCGNGGFLSYWLIAYDAGPSAYVLLERSGLAQGLIELQPAAIAEWESGRLTLLQWNGAGFVPQRAVPTPIPSGAVVRYWIEPTDSPDGRCDVRVENGPEIGLRVGERLQLLRSDLSECSERLFASGPLEWSDEHSVLRAVGTGEAAVRIAPHEYDSALELRIVVTE
jgi:hypothetical protein